MTFSNTKTVTLYHGTNEYWAEQLLKNGFNPDRKILGANQGKWGYLYLTTDHHNAAWFAEQNGGKSILEITIPVENIIVDPEDGVGETVEDEFEYSQKYHMPGNFATNKPISSNNIKIFNNDINEELLGRSKNGPSYFQMGGGIKNKNLYNKTNKGKATKDPGVAALRKESVMNNQEEIKILQNLKDRGVDLNKIYAIVDEDSNTATFLLFNLSGQLIGYQQYNPNKDKVANNDPKNARYYTYVSKHAKHIAVWGVESLDNRGFLFVTEGIFDAVKLHNLGLPAVATLTNHPKILKSWFKAMNKKVIAVCDNDPSGRKLASIGHISITVPDPYKDLGDMPETEIKDWLKKTLKIS
jgi:hypothetical protein